MLGRQGLGRCLFQGFWGGDLQPLTTHRGGDIALVVFAKHGPGLAFRIIAEKEPVAVPAGQIDGGVAPGLCRLGRPRTAGLDIGIVGRWQAEVRQVLAAAFEHAVQGGQVLAVFDGMLRPPQYLLYGVVCQGLQPQFLDLLELLCIRVGGVILVVVIEAEQGKDLVDRLNMRLRALPAAWLSRPSWCR